MAMDDTTRWLVCAGPCEFMSIVAALVCAGCAGKIEWERVASSAYTRAAQLRGLGRTSAVVGEGAGRETPGEVASILAGLVDGETILCTKDPSVPRERLIERGVSAVVGPDDLFRALIGPGAGDGVPATPAPAGDPAGEFPCGLWDDVPGLVADPASASLPGPAPVPEFPTGAPEGAAVQAAPAAPSARAQNPAPSLIVPSAPAAAPPVAAPAAAATAPAARLRPEDPRLDFGAPAAAACAPAAAARVPDPFDFLEEPEDVAPPVCAGDSSRPAVRPMRSASGLPHTGAVVPAETAAVSRPGRVIQGIKTEPVVYMPVVDLPQMECDVAGLEDPVPTICFTSSRGGVGKTALAVLTALTLARDGLSVALVDFDLQFGTCLGYLGADETDGLVDPGAAPGKVEVNARTLARCRTTPESRLAAYEFCRVPEQSEMLTDVATKLLKSARAGADVAVVDLPTGMGEVSAQVLDLADRCLFVADQRAFSLESLAVQQALCARMGLARTKLVTVMNRCDPRHRDESFLSRVRFEVQTPQVMRVADGGPEVAQMLSIGSAGELLSMRNRFALSVADLAHAICADLGCRAGGRDAPAQTWAPPSQAARPQQREGLFQRYRKERRGERAACLY